MSVRANSNERGSRLTCSNPTDLDDPETHDLALAETALTGQQQPRQRSAANTCAAQTVDLLGFRS